MIHLISQTTQSQWITPRVLAWELLDFHRLLATFSVRHGGCPFGAGQKVLSATDGSGGDSISICMYIRSSIGISISIRVGVNGSRSLRLSTNMILHYMLIYIISDIIYRERERCCAPPKGGGLLSRPSCGDRCSGTERQQPPAPRIA